jgi:hypothetical protein
LAGEIVIAAVARGRLSSPQADLYARLAGVSRLLKVLAAGRPIAKRPNR